MSATFEDLNIVVSKQMESISAKTALSLEELIVQLRASGASEAIIKQRVLADLENASRIFGMYRNGVKNNMKDAILSAGNIASATAYRNAGVTEFKWITVSTSPCPDCVERHGTIGEVDFFETIGLPKSGFSVCGTHCQCQIVPEKYQGEGKDAPIIRKIGRGNKKS